MKRFLLLLVVCLCSWALSAKADNMCNSPEKQREFKEFKMKYLAQEMELKESQREKFFELYDKMNEEKRAAFAKVHKMEKKMRAEKDLTDADYEQFQALMNEARAKDLEIDKKYDAEFLKVISTKQLYKFKSAEFKFRDKMREMRDSKKSKKNHKNKGSNKK